MDGYDVEFWTLGYTEAVSTPTQLHCMGQDWTWGHDLEMFSHNADKITLILHFIWRHHAQIVPSLWSKSNVGGVKGAVVPCLARARLVAVGGWDDRRMETESQRKEEAPPLHLSILLPWACDLVLQKFPSEGSQSRRRPLLGPSPGWKCLLPLSHLRHY